MGSDEPTKASYANQLTQIHA